jgi:hypothetical protein
VSDVFSRLAARAVGQAAVAQPRLPALFEPTAEPLEVYGEEVAPAPTPATRHDAEPAVRTTSRRSEPVAEPQRPLEREAAEPAVERIRAETRETRQLVLRERRRTHTGTPIVATPPAVPVPVPATPLTPPAPPREPVAVAAAPEEPAVRVHIGRLEVRASLEAPPRAAPKGPEPQPEPSLSAYLRGER